MSSLTDYISSRATAASPNYGGLLSPNTNYKGLLSNLKAPTPPTLSLNAIANSPAATTPTVKPSMGATGSFTAPQQATPVTSSAGQQYIASRTQGSDTSSYSLPVPQVQDVAAINAARSAAVSSGQNPYTGAGATSTSTNAGLGGATGSSPTSDPFSEYAAYLKSLQGPATTAAQRLADIQDQEEKLTLDTRRAADNELNNTPGRYQSANVDASNLVNKNASSQMADLALEENAASRSAQVAQTALGNAKPLQIGDNYYDPSTGKLLSTKAQAGFTLNPGDTRYEVNPATGKYEAVGGGSSNTSGQYTPGSNPLVDQWAQNIKTGAGGAKLSDVPAELKSQVSAALAQSGSSQNDILGTTVKSLKELQDMVDNNNGFEAAVGLPDVLSHPVNFTEALFTGSQGSQLPGTQAADFVAKLNQVKNDVILPNLTLLHGLGRVTDREFQALTSAVTALGPNLSESQFKTELKNITDQINAKAGQSSGSQSSGSGGGSVFATQW